MAILAHEEFSVRVLRVREWYEHEHANGWHYVLSFESTVKGVLKTTDVYLDLEDDLNKDPTVKWLSRNAIKNFLAGTHDLYYHYTGHYQKFVKLTNELARYNTQQDPIIKYVEKEHEPITYINYEDYEIFTQLDGITTIVGMTGAGKTWSAIRMLRIYAEYFDKILYLNYELPERDVISRLNNQMNVHEVKKVTDKLYINPEVMTELDLHKLLDAVDYQPGEKLVFIVDNIDSVKGQDDDVFQQQDRFIKQLDVICKRHGWHALVLAQMIKDNKMKIFDQNGFFTSGLSTNIVSGTKAIGDLSRSVLFTAYWDDVESGGFKQKTLKRGSGIFYANLQTKETVKSFIKKA